MEDKHSDQIDNTSQEVSNNSNNIDSQNTIISTVSVDDSRSNSSVVNAVNVLTTIFFAFYSIIIFVFYSFAFFTDNTTHDSLNRTCSSITFSSIFVYAFSLLVIMLPAKNTAKSMFLAISVVTATITILALDHANGIVPYGSAPFNAVPYMIPSIVALISAIFGFMYYTIKAESKKRYYAIIVNLLLGLALAGLVFFMFNN